MSSSEGIREDQNRTRNLPKCLLDSWRLKPCIEEEIRKQLGDHNVSSLLKTYLDIRLKAYFDSQGKKHVHSTSSLSSLAVGSILEALNTSSSLARDASTIIDSLDSTTFKRLLIDPRLSYPTFRYLLSLTSLSTDRVFQQAVDTDEAILRNERYLRSRREGNKDGKYLIRLRELPDLIFGSILDTQRKVLSFVRQDISKGGLEVLDYVRNENKSVDINATDDSFSRTFDRITKGVLDGLNWSNVFMAGVMPLTALMHTKPSKDDDRAIKDGDIELYIYGLGPGDANAKVQHIYETWSRNLPALSRGRLVVKNAKTINLLADYPNRRIQILLKLLPSPTDVLLNFDLDACAVGYDGSQVLMLPRFARALETGYSVFTMDLVWGNFLGDRHATQDSRIFRVFEFANKGFGLRFLPSYARSLEQDRTKLFQLEHNDIDQENVDKASSDYLYVLRDRYPNGLEPGLKTLKRIAYLGQDYVNRFYFGATPLAISWERYQKIIDADHVINEEMEAVWQKAFDITQQEEADIRRMNDLRRANDQPCEGPLMNLASLDSGLPNGRRGLSNFEIFMRHCEVWRLDARADATLERDIFASTIYDDGDYDDLPTYDWGPHFSLLEFDLDIENANLAYWTSTKAAICRKLSRPTVLSGFSDYATRRLRRQVDGQDLEQVMAKQLTIPIIIPHSLEQYILHTLPSLYPDLPEHLTSQPCLIPLHDPTQHERDLPYPSVLDTDSEDGNLRFWVIDNNSMWACQHRVIDEIQDILWPLFHWLMLQSPDNLPNPLPVDTSHPQCLLHIARFICQRMVLSEVLEDGELGPGLPSASEAYLFRAWALNTPELQDHDFSDEAGGHELFREECIRYPFEDELFWKGDANELGEE